MNVTTTPSPTAAASGAPSTPTDESASALPAGTFGDLLSLVTASTPLPPPAAPVLPDPDAESPDDRVDWSLPFVAPTTPSAPVPLDFELAGPELAAPGGVARRGEHPLETATFAVVEDLPTGLLDRPPAASRLETAAQLPAPSGHVRHVSAPVGEARWSGQLGHELRLLVDRGVQSATLRLNPEHLGPVEVHIEIVQDKASVVFGASQAETRAALQEAIPRLREMFAAGGLALGDAGVRDDRARAQSRTAGRPEPWDRADGNPAPGAESVRIQLGLVDAYA